MKQNIKYTIILIVSLFPGISAFSQQEPLYTQYMFNTVSVNPAYTGTTNSLNLVALSRYQWVGLSGAPKTYTVSMHAPVRSKKMGLGMSIVQDEVGPSRNFYLSADYAYRVNLTDKLTLSLGLKAGIYNYYIGLSKLELVNNGDNTFQQDEQKRLNPNIGTGFYLYTSKWYAGLAAPTLLENALDKTSTTGLANLKRHYYFIAGYILPINTEWSFKPSMVEKVVWGSPISTDLTAQFLYKEKIWMGASYRIGDALAFLVDIRVTNQILLGYSYDITLSKLSGYSAGSHEVLISFDFERFGSHKVKSPRYF
jgi:type IX secretion system PorP/SprF family membrane protein